VAPVEELCDEVEMDERVLLSGGQGECKRWV